MKTNIEFLCLVSKGIKKKNNSNSRTIKALQCGSMHDVERSREFRSSTVKQTQHWKTGASIASHTNKSAITSCTEKVVSLIA